MNYHNGKAVNAGHMEILIKEDGSVRISEKFGNRPVIKTIANLNGVDALNIFKEVVERLEKILFA